MAFSAQRALLSSFRVIYERGYLWYGLNSALTTLANKSGWSFTTETNFDPANGDMPSALTRLCTAVCGNEAGYPAGGRTSGGTLMDDINKMIWATEVDSVIAALLGKGNRLFASGVESRLTRKGYYLGGDSPTSGTETTDIEGLNFTTEAYINVATAIQDTKRTRSASYSSDTKGYHVGGTDGATRQTDISCIVFSNETAQNPTAVIAAARAGCHGTQSQTRGYCGAGDNSEQRVDSLLFSTDTNTDLGATFLTIRQEDSVGLSSTTKGYWCSGTHAGATANIKTDVQAVNFSNDTFNDPTGVVQSPGTIQHTGGQQWSQHQ